MNEDGVIITQAFAGFTNAEGITTLTTANDSAGNQWRGGSVTIMATPILYGTRRLVDGRAKGSLTITLPGAMEASQTIVPSVNGPVSVTYWRLRNLGRA